MHTVENEGARIAYRRTGDGPAVLLIQGVGLEGRAWQPQVEALAPSYTVIDFDHLSQVFGRDLANQPPIAMRQLRAWGRYDAGQRLAALRDIPTLVVSAELDRIAGPPSGRALADAIPGARYVEVPGVGHAVPAYRPDVLNPVLLSHLVESADARR